jgi:hypothetical protein
MATMAKKKPPSQADSAPSPQPGKDAGDRHKYPIVSLRPPEGMRELLKQLAREQRRSVSQTILLLLEEILLQKGKWPPPDQAKDE